MIKQKVFPFEWLDLRVKRALTCLFKDRDGLRVNKSAMDAASLRPLSAPPHPTRVCIDPPEGQTGRNGGWQSAFYCCRSQRSLIKIFCPVCLKNEDNYLNNLFMFIRWNCSVLILLHGKVKLILSGRLSKTELSINYSTCLM